MEYKQAIADLKKQEGNSDLVATVENELERLTGKNYELIGENRKASAKVATLQTSIDAIVEATGVDGEDITAKLTAATEKVKALATQLSEANTRASTAETKLTGLEDKATITKVATKSGAVADVLQKLLGDRVSEFVIDGDIVKLGDKTLREFVEADSDLSPFIPALFPGNQSPSTPQLPSAPPNGKAPTPANPVDAYLEKTYTVPVVAIPQV